MRGTPLVTPAERPCLAYASVAAFAARYRITLSVGGKRAKIQAKALDSLDGFLHENADLADG